MQRVPEIYNSFSWNDWFHLLFVLRWKGKRELACEFLQITFKPVDRKSFNRKVFFVFDKHIKNIVYTYLQWRYIYICILRSRKIYIHSKRLDGSKLCDRHFVSHTSNKFSFIDIENVFRFGLRVFVFFLSKLALCVVGFGYWKCMFYGETVELE